MRLAVRLAIPALLAGMTLVACASTAGSGATAAPAASAAAKTAAVAIKGFAFSPAALTVSPGAVVTFTNNDSTTHSISSGADRTKDGKFDIQISGSTEGTVRFDTPGTFQYFCMFHASMRGTVTVQ